ncbi:MAG: MATE family efflux transporter [Lachnospiraceae bacterium]|nr:MATE family efflux transporter [Lachnospiraceae bacterium]
MKRFIGDRAFYKRVLTIAIPIIIQNGITNFVSLLDNIMVGRIGTEEMSGVAIINQLFFVFYLGIFGAISGAGIFTAQYVGQKNTEGVRHTLRFKLLEAVVLSAAGALIFIFFKDQLISLYLHEQGESIDAASTLRYGTLYLNVMIFGLLPFAVTQCYSGTLRECGETLVPMSAGVIAVCVNLFLNYVLIFGNFGAPVLGVEGAAIATVTSRMVELLIVVLWTHLNREKNPFAVGLYRGFSIPSSLALKILIMGTPLFLNEFFWSMGIAALTQCYSIRGLSVVAAFNISSTIINLFKVFVISMGNVVAIMIGQILGSGDVSHVVETDNRLIAFSIAVSVVLGVIQFIMAPLFPEFYNTGEEIKKLAAEFICIAAFYLPMEAFLNSAYFTIRSGGRTVITFIFDSVFLWFVSWPAAFILSRYTSCSIEIIYTAVLALDSIKVLIGFIMLKKKIWIRDLVRE